MNKATKMSSAGSDWTRLLTDPDLVSHLGKLLQTYREVSPEQREAALLRAMREIKDAAVKGREAPGESGNKAVSATPAPVAELPRPEAIVDTPPFEPDFVSESDRRRFQRIKCYVAVEIHIEGQETPVWGNLNNVSRGGCLVETASVVPSGKALEIGLWVAQRQDLGERRHDQRDGYAQRTLVWSTGQVFPGGTIGKGTPARVSEIRGEFRPQVAKRKSLRDATQELDFPL